MKFSFLFFYLSFPLLTFSQNSEYKAFKASLINYDIYRIIKFENLTDCDFVLPKIYWENDSINNFVEIRNDFDIYNKKTHKILSSHLLLNAKTSINFIIDDRFSNFDIRVIILFFANEYCEFKFESDFYDKVYYECLEF